MTRHTYSWLIWVFAAAFLIYKDAATFALFSIPLLFVAAALQLPIGMAMDVLGVRRVFVFAGLLMAVGGVVAAFSYDALSLETGRMMMGIGAAFGFIGLVIATTRYLPERHWATFIGIGSSLGILSNELGGLYATFFEWRPVVFVMGIIGASFSLFFHHFKRAVQVESEKMSAWTNLKLVGKKGSNWLMALALLGFFPLTATLFGNALPVVLGLIVGAPVIGSLSDFMRRRKPLLLLTQFFTLCAVILNIYFASSVFLALMGFFSAGFLLFYPFAVENNPKEISATAVGFVSTIALLGATLFRLFGTINALPSLLLVSLILTVILKEPRKKKEKALKIIDKLMEKADEIQRFKKAG